MLIIIKEIFLKYNLIWELAVKDLKIRYCRPLLGFFWAFLLPFWTAIIFFVIFSLLLKSQIQEAPFLLYIMVAVFSWSFFQNSLISSVTCLTDNKNLIRESGFAHYLIPVSIVLANIINFLPALLVLLVISLCVLKGVSVYILLLPVILAIHITVTAGLAIIVSVLYVKWRDVKYVLEVVLMPLFYFTPAFYSVFLIKSILPGLLYKAYLYTPFVSILYLYRIALLKKFYSAMSNDISILISIVSSSIFAVFIFWLGTFIYKRNKNTINDHLSY